MLQRIVCRIDRLNFIFNYHCKLQESSFERNTVIYPHIIISFIMRRSFLLEPLSKSVMVSIFLVNLINCRVLYFVFSCDRAHK